MAARKNEISLFVLKIFALVRAFNRVNILKMNSK